MYRYKASTIEEQGANISNAWECDDVCDPSVDELEIMILESRPFILFHEIIDNRGVFFRRGCFVVGFENTNACPVEYGLYFGNICVETVCLAPGERRPALWGCAPIPLVLMRFHPVCIRIKVPEHTLKCIHLRNNYSHSPMRQYLNNGAFVNHPAEDTSIMFMSGMSCFATSRVGANTGMLALPLIELDTAEMRRARAMSRTETIRQELMKETWNPRRVQRWCWDVAEQREFAEDPIVLDNTMQLADCDALLKGAPPTTGLHAWPDAWRVFQKIVDCLPGNLGNWKLAGDKVSCIRSNAGMFWHRDNSLQGGTHSLLVYLTTPTKGGETVFETMSISPVRGRAVLFSVHALHMAAPVPVSHGLKLAVAVEILHV